jgi:(1->4)-alpha-D-glucan 1-alpha-D-glucosylmutase
MLCGSTHDSKRGEDVRARINVLSEIPDEWRKRLAVWSRLNRSRKRLVDEQRWPDRNDEYLLYQTLVGTWPNQELNEEVLDAYRSRIEAYMLKAIREAKVHTSWINPNEEYEESMHHFIRRLFFSPAKNRFIAGFLPFQRRISRLGMFNSLSQLTLRLTSPGVPDVYQGSLNWSYTLVDPDNRRPVDYDRITARFRGIQAEMADSETDRRRFARSLLDDLEDGRIKQFIVTRVLATRRDLPALFRDGSYLPLETEGVHAEHLFAFARQEGGRTLLVIVPRWFARLVPDMESLPLGTSVWRDSSVLLPAELDEQPYRDLFTGAMVNSDPRTHGPALQAGAVLSDFPVAVLLSENVGAR